MGSALAAGGILAISDGPAPFGEAAAGVLIAGAGIYIVGDYLIDKMAKELSGITARLQGPEAEQYSLRAMSSGEYPNVRGGMTYLNAGDVYKYGQTTDPAGRYSRDELATLGVRYVTEFRGTQMQALMQEKYKIYGHFMEHGSLPAGNSIFR